MAVENVTMAAGADDATEEDDDTGFDATGTIIIMASFALPSPNAQGGFRFAIPNITNADTITAATMDLYARGNDDPDHDIYCEDVDNAANFTDNADLVNRVLTTAFVIYSAVGLGGFQYHTTADFVAAAAEVMGRGGWSAGNNLMVILNGRSSASDYSFYVNAYEHADASTEPKISITYSVGAAGLSIPIAMHHYKQLMGAN